MKLTSMKAALAVMSAGMVLVSCGNEGPNLKGNLKMDRDTLLIQAVWQKKSLLDTVVLKNGHFETTIPDSVCFIYLFPKPKSEDEMITMCPKSAGEFHIKQQGCTPGQAELGKSGTGRTGP